MNESASVTKHLLFSNSSVIFFKESLKWMNQYPLLGVWTVLSFWMSHSSEHINNESFTSCVFFANDSVFLNESLKWKNRYPPGDVFRSWRILFKRVTKVNRVNCKRFCPFTWITKVDWLVSITGYVWFINKSVWISIGHWTWFICEWFCLFERVSKMNEWITNVNQSVFINTTQKTCWITDTDLFTLMVLSFWMSHQGERISIGHC